MAPKCAILQNFSVLVYPRPGVNKEGLIDHQNINHMNCPIIEMSASYIRKRVKEKQSIRYMLPENIIQYIEDKGLYI